jgi:hypothetical protein
VKFDDGSTFIIPERQSMSRPAYHSYLWSKYIMLQDMEKLGLDRSNPSHAISFTALEKAELNLLILGKPVTFSKLK